MHLPSGFAMREGANLECYKIMKFVIYKFFDGFSRFGDSELLELGEICNLEICRRVGRCEFTISLDGIAGDSICHEIP